MNYTVRQLAARWSCSEEHVRRMIRTKQIRAFKIGTTKGTRISAEEVEKWEAEKMTDQSASPEPMAIGSLTSLC